MALAARAPACDALQQNVLTSVDCPTRCAAAPCVLYAPSQPLHCLTTCFPDASVVTNCTITVQCLDALVDNQHTWTLALAADGVTEVRSLAYPTVGLSTVKVAGGDHARGQFHNVTLDDSIFATPLSVTIFSLSDIDVPTALDALEFAKRNWTSVTFNNCNLTHVPAGLSELSLQSVALTNNFITTISDPTPFRNVSALNLAFKELTDLPIAMPSIVTLNLMGNPLMRFPDSIFSMKTLKTLSMRQCNLTNVALTETQVAFLQQLLTFDCELTVTSCPNGTISKPLLLSSVCVRTPSAITSRRSHTTTIIVVVSVGVVILTTIAVLVLCLKRRRRREKEKYATDFALIHDDTKPLAPNNRRPQLEAVFSSDHDLLIVRIEASDIELLLPLSRGGVTRVWLGRYVKEHVAVKQLNSDWEMHTVRFAAEIKLIARLANPNIVRFIGAAWTTLMKPQAVAEFMDGGDLQSFLRSDRAAALSWANTKYQIAIDIADALVYLHTLPSQLTFRTLHSRNVLLDAHKLNAKLSIFDIGEEPPTDDTVFPGINLDHRWVAPEVLVGDAAVASDIYSLGVVLSELDTMQVPYEDAVEPNGVRMPETKIITLIAMGKRHPSFTASCPEALATLARACLSYDPAQRPSAVDVATKLRKIRTEESSY